MRAIFRALLVFALILGLVVAALRVTCIEFWTIPSDDLELAASIVPTLAPGDRVVIWTHSRPDYASVVQCPHPESSTRVAVGRILGEATDRIRIDATMVSVNDRGVHSARACRIHNWTAVDPASGEAVSLVCEEEETGGIAYTRVRAASQTWHAGTRPVQVPTNHVFLVSDNRALPYDSRDYGTVERSGCRTIAFRLWSAQGWSDSDRRLTIIH